MIRTFKVGGVVWECWVYECHSSKYWFCVKTPFLDGVPEGHNRRTEVEAWVCCEAFMAAMGAVEVPE